MGLALPDQLTEPMSWIGVEWPEADEDLLREAGQRWIDFGLALAPAAAPASVSAQRVWESAEGDAAAAFEAWWNGEDGPPQRLSDDAEAALLIGGALLAFAVITLIVKLSIIVQLVSLVALVAQAVLTAFFTLGAASAEIPVFIAASRLAARKLLNQLLHHVESIVREVLAKARALLKRGGRTGVHAADSGLTVVHPVPARQTTPRYTGKPLGDAFRREADWFDPKPFGTRVRRLTRAEQEQHRIFVDGAGLLRHAHDGSLFDTGNAVSVHNGPGRAIFVQDEAGNIYASNYQEIGRFHHSTLSQGKPVASAGEIMVMDGRLDGVTAASGHYQPGPQEMQQFVDEMGRHGVSNFPVYSFDGVTRWN